MMISNRIKIPQGLFVRCLIMMHFRRSRVWRLSALTIGLIIFLLTIVGIVYDIRLIILSLMIVLIIIPMIISLVYINDAFSPANFYNTLPHRILVENNQIVVVIYLQPNRETPQEFDEQPEKDTEEEVEIERRLELTGYETGAYYSTSRHILLPLARRGSEGVLILPIDSFGTIDNLKTFIKQIYDYTSRKA